ncbi:co-chaperone HscB [Shewanella gelidii]|uniref:Co-chaperone protein HscB homolog n=1 Tax=Shewanella gelidii TaxID=1642821 RepID=A0A917JLX7_9GAMM|nr:co-chaperone HscB [Shewanella gelidii]MCL1097509.1 co-chaperone HscB [Shewanella gelidii]GGI75784.1 co-chaperone protein HscB [Shewanella gelidii]
MNYFELFNFTASFDLDTATLAERYRELQRAVHPDNFANDTEQQKLLSIHRAAQINDGFQTLKNPIRRAEHMLSLRNIDISHETKTLKDGQFLMQQMEWREALEDINHAEDPDEMIDELYRSFSNYENEMTKRLIALLNSEQENDWLLAADQVRKLKFMAKLKDELAKIEDAQFG